MTSAEFLEDLQGIDVAVPTITDIYAYTDEKGFVIYDKIRIEPGLDGKKKDFRIRKYEDHATQAYPNIGASGSDIFHTPKGLSWGIDGRVPLLYNLPSVLASQEVILTEGEKDSKTAIKLGYTGTCIFDGSQGEWLHGYTQALIGKDVILFADQDEPGKKFAQTVERNLSGRVNSFCIVNVPKGKDLTDYVVDHSATKADCDALILAARSEGNPQVKKTLELVQRRGLPSSHESEKLILGLIIMGIESIDEIACSITTDSFTLETHKEIYQCLLDLAEQGVQSDKSALVQSLSDKGNLELVGGPEYILDLTDDLPPAYNLQHHIEAIVKKSQNRDLITSMMSSVEDLVMGKDLDVVRTNVSKALELVDKNSLAYRSGPAKVVDVLGSDDNFFKPSPPGIKNNINELNLWSNGIHKGELLVIAGRPGAGKTSLGNQICAYAAFEGYRVDIFSYEEREEIHLKKIICSLAKVPYSRLRDGWLTSEERRRIVAAKKKLQETNLNIVDAAKCGNWTTRDYRSYLKQQISKGDPVRVLMVDYLQLMRLPNADRHDIKIGMLTRDFKLMANEFGITVILLSQLSRAGEKENRKPTLSDLRDSGSIESDANSVIFVWQDLKDNEDPCGHRDAELIFGKLREGPTGSIKVKYWKPFTWFCDRDYFDKPNDLTSYLVSEVHSNYRSFANQLVQ